MNLATLNDLKLEKAVWLPLIVPGALGSHQRRTARGRGKLSKSYWIAGLFSSLT